MQNHVCRLFSAHSSTHTHTPTDMSILTIQNGTHNLNGQQRLDLNPFTEEQPLVCSDQFPVFSWTQQAMGLTFAMIWHTVSPCIRSFNHNAHYTPVCSSALMLVHGDQFDLISVTWWLSSKNRATHARQNLHWCVWNGGLGDKRCTSKSTPTFSHCHLCPCLQQEPIQSNI